MKRSTIIIICSLLSALAMSSISLLPPDRTSSVDAEVSSLENSDWISISRSEMYTDPAFQHLKHLELYNYFYLNTKSGEYMGVKLPMAWDGRGGCDWRRGACAYSGVEPLGGGGSSNPNSSPAKSHPEQKTDTLIPPSSPQSGDSISNSNQDIHLK